MDKRTIIVQLATPEWTLKAIHLACAMASRTGAGVALVRMIPVPHIGLLGEEMGEVRLSDREQALAQQCYTVATDYGITLQLVRFQYFSLAEALVQVVPYLDAQAIFAHLSPISFPFWHRFRVWLLQSKLQLLNCDLYTLDTPVNQPETAPFILLNATHK